MKRKANGSTSTIDVASLPQKPRRRRRHNYTKEERAQILQRIQDACAGGMMIKDACKREGIGRSMHLRWRDTPSLTKTPTSTPPKANGSAVRIMMDIAGRPIIMSIEEARTVHDSLGAFLKA